MYPMIGLYFLCGNLFSVALGNGDNYTLTMDTFHSVERSETPIGGVPNFEEHYLVKLSDEQRKNLCVAARNTASLDGKDHNIAVNSIPENYSIRKGDETYDDIMMLCDTIPPSYLRLEDSSTPTNIRITILLKWNKYETEEYSFEEQSVCAVSETFKGQIVEDALLANLTPADRLDICVAAKKRAQQIKLELVRSEVDEPKVFKIKYKQTGSSSRRSWRVKLTEIVFSELERPAIECPSDPLFYVRFENSPNKIKILLVDQSF